MTPHKKGKVLEEPVTFFTDKNKDLLDQKWVPGHYVFDGYFQKSHWYWSRREEILKFAKPIPEVTEINTKDLLVSLRVRADYRRWNWVIDPSWFLEIIEKERFDRLHIVTDYRDDTYLGHFKKYDPIIVDDGTVGNWTYLRSFARHVSANSTFCWWAIFFGNAPNPYIFKPWNARPRPQLVEFPGAVVVDGKFEHPPCK